MIVRPAEPRDETAIAGVVAAAFGRDEEAAIVAGVRREGAVLCEIVAEEAGAIVGHVLFSRMSVRPPRPIACLGPLAVAPDAQRRGIGSALTRVGVECCRELGSQAVVVLGHPAYYPRFGFSHQAAGALASPFADRPAFMALALSPGALDEPLAVAYPSAFG